MQKTGVQLIAEGAAKYFSDLAKAAEAEANLAREAAAAARPVAGLGDAADKAGSQFGGFQQIVTGALRGVGSAAVDLAAEGAKALGSFVAGSVTAAGDFQANMNTFAGVTGSALAESGKSLNDFKQLFISLGKELPVSTAEVQQAAIELAKGGIEPSVIAAGALRTSLDLAAAGGIGLADSATIMAKQLGVWVDSTADAGTKAAFLAQTADLLAQSANATTSDVSDLAIGLANAGGTAKVAGLSFRETVTGLSLLAPGFSSASDAGTSFKTFLSKLVPSARPAIDAMTELGLYTKETGSVFYDQQGKFIGLKAAAEKLRAATEGLSEAQKIQAFNTVFGSDAIRAAAILSEQGAAGYDRMTAALAAAGSVQQQAAARQQGFNVALDNAGGSLEALQLAIGGMLLPALTTLLNSGVSPVINGITGFVEALSSSQTTIGSIASFVASALVPALYGATAATIAYGLANTATLVPSLIASIAKVAAATSAMIANAAATVAAAAPYALIALAVAGMAMAYQGFQDKVAAATDALLESRTWWTDSADAMEAYRNSSEAVKNAAGPQAKAIEQVRNQLHEELQALGAAEAAGMVSDAQRKQAMISINSHANTLKVLTAQVNDEIAAQNRAAAASLTATSALQTMQSGAQNLAPAIELTEKEIEKLGKAIEQNFQQGAEALGKYVQTETAFLTDAAARRSEHESKIEALVKEKGAAQTAAQAAEIQKRIEAERSGYAQQEQAAAESYAKQQAAQNAHLGKMLIDYVVAQAQLGNIGKEKAAELTDEITAQFGIQEDVMSSTYLRMIGNIDQWAQSSNVSAQQAVSGLVAQRDEAVRTQQVMDAGAKDYVTKVVTDYIENGGTIDSYVANLHKLPTATGEAASATKAAWVANSADFEMLASTSAGYLATGIQSGTPAITNAAAAAGSGAGVAWTSGTANFPELSVKAGQALADGLTSSTPAAQAAAGAVASSAGAAYVANSADFEMLASSSASYLATGIASQSGAATEAGSTLGSNVATGFASGAAAAPQAGTDAGNQINSGLQGVSSTIQGTTSQMGQGATQGFTSGASGAQQAGTETGTDVATGISGAANAVQSAGRSAGEAAVQGAAAGGAGAQGVGKNIAAGIAAGISAGTPAIQNAARAAAQSSLDAAKSSLAIHSPSAVAADEIGQPFSVGIGVGITAGSPFAIGASTNVAHEMIAGASGVVKTTAPPVGTSFSQGVGAGITKGTPAALAAVRQLYQQLGAASTAMSFNFAKNDFDLVGKDQTAEQINQLKIREEAEKQYMARMEAARNEARQTARDGDAQLAKDVLAAKESEAKDLMDIEQTYMQKRAEVSKDQLPQLEEIYTRAVEMRREQTGDEIAIARSAANERIATAQNEADKTIAATQRQSDGVVAVTQQQATDVGTATGQGTAQGVESTAGAVQQAGETAGQAAVQGATEGAADAEDAGKNIASGIAKGIDAGTPAIVSAARSAARAALDAAKAELGVASPSKEFADQVGSPAIQGMIVGMRVKIPALKSAAADAASGGLEAAKEGIGSDGTTSTASYEGIGLPFVDGIVEGISDSLDLIKGISRTLSKQLTEDMKLAAEEAVAAFKAILQANLEADAGFSGTALGNYRKLQDLGEGSKTAEAQQDVTDTQADLDAQNKEKIAAEQEYSKTVEALQKEREQKLFAARAKIQVLDYEHQQAMANETDPIKREQLQAKYIEERGKLLSEVGSIDAEYGQKITDATTAYHDRVTAIDAEIAKLQQALDLAKARVLVEQELDEKRKALVATAQAELEKARQEADAMRQTDPKAADDYYKLRSQQILELADLEKRQAEALAKYRTTGAAADRDAVQAIETERAMLLANQAAERTLLAANAQQNSPYAGLAEQLSNLQNKIRAELEHDQGFYDHTDRNNLAMRDRLANEIAGDQAALNQITAQLEILGHAMMNGVSEGINGSTADTMAAIQNALQLIQRAAEQELGISSPSKVLKKEIGLPAMEGIAQGVIKGAGLVEKAFGSSLNQAMVMPAAQTIRPAASAGQIANSYTNNYSRSVNIGSFSAANGVSKAQVAVMIDQAMARSGRSAYTRQRTT